MRSAIVAGVAARARPLEREGDCAVAVIVPAARRPDVAEEQHPVRSPVIEDVREDVEIHERALELARRRPAPIAVRVPQTNRRLARIDADAEHVEVEHALDVAVVVGMSPFDAEAALARARPRSGRSRRTRPANDGSLRRPVDVEPVGIVRA